MTPKEANVLLTKAALVDPRLKRVDLVDQADMAQAWAELLDDVALEDALVALRTLQRSRGASDPAIQPADILATLAIATDDPHDPVAVDFTREFVQHEVRGVLRELGMTEVDYDSNPDVRQLVADRMKPLELEEGE